MHDAQCIFVIYKDIIKRYHDLTQNWHFPWNQVEPCNNIDLYFYVLEYI